MYQALEDAFAARTREHAALATREEKDVGLHAAIAAFGRDKFTVRLLPGECKHAPLTEGCYTTVTGLHD